MHRLITITTALVLIASGWAAPASAQDAPDRVAGSDRFTTAVAAAQRGWPRGSDVVVVTTGLAFADALAATPLAAVEDAPLLLVAPTGLGPDVHDELVRLGPGRVIVVGGEAAVPRRVRDEIRAALPGVRTTVLSGPDRNATAARVARHVEDRAGSDLAIVASGRTFADAVAAGAFAASAIPLPLLLTEADVLPTPTAQMLADERIEQAFVMGGRSAVSDRVVADIEALGVSVTRVAGVDRFATSAAAIDRSRTFTRTGPVVVVTGMDFPDALAGGPLVARLGGTLALVPDAHLPDSIRRAVARAATRGDVDAALAVGGRRAVPDAIAREVADIVDEHR